MKKNVIIVVLAVIFFTSLGAVINRTLWARGGQVDGVRITVEGKIVYEIDFLTDSLPKTLEIQGKNGIESTVVVEDGRVHVAHANCPDQICVNQGWIVDSAMPIVCLPGEIIIEMIGGDANGLDTATG